MATNTKPVNDVNDPVDAPVTNANANGMPRYEGDDRSQEAIIKYMLSNGATLIKGVTAKNVTINEQENYVRVALTLDKKVPGMVVNPDDENTYIEGKTNVIFASLYSFTAQFKESAKTAFLANYLVSHPKAVALIMSYAKFDIVQESVNAGDTYYNQWSESDTKGTVIDHHTIFNNVVRIKLSDEGKEWAKEIGREIMLGH